MTIEDRVRDSLTRAADKVEPSDDAWLTVTGRMKKKTVSSRLSLGVIVALALAISLGALTGLWIVFRSGTSTLPADSGPTDPEPVIEDVISLPPAARGIAVADGSVWVAVSEVDLSSGCSGAFIQIDPVTGSLTEPTSTSGVPTAIAAGGGSVWIAQQACGENGQPTGDGEIRRYDAGSGQLLDEVAVSDVEGGPSDIAYGASLVWTTWGQDPGEVVVVDPSTNTIVGRIPVEGRLRDVEATEDAVWVLDTGPEDGSLVRIDPVTKAIVTTVPLGESPFGLVATDTEVWTSGADGLVRIDAATNTVIDVRTTGIGPQPLMADATGVWFVAYYQESGGHELSHLDDDSVEVDATIALPAYPVDAGIDVASRTMWILGYEQGASKVSY